MRKRIIAYLATFIPLFIMMSYVVNAQFYHPNNEDYGSPAKFGLQHEDLHFKSSDGVQLHGWYIQAQQSPKKGTILHFHGNAQNISAHLNGVYWLAEAGYDLYLIDYRGFGRSKGKPDQKGVFADCVAAIELVQARLKDGEGFVILGQSMGAANAIAVSGEKKFENLRGVIAEAPFYSYRTIAKDKVGGLLTPLVGVFVKDHKSPHLVVGDISPTPLLIVHGTADVVVPYQHGKDLYEDAKEPKELWTVPGAGHLDIFYDPENQSKLLQLLEIWFKE
ncbi:MAG: alpha/beta hydrolase [Opitutales bacterium]